MADQIDWKKINYNEDLSGTFSLPDPLLKSDGTYINSIQEWEEQRKKILTLFKDHIYGDAPSLIPAVSMKERPARHLVLDSRAEMMCPVMELSLEKKKSLIDVLIILPETHDISSKIPVFLGLNFFGNQTVLPDPIIPLYDGWLENDNAMGVKNLRVSENSRGSQVNAWCVEKIVKRGYGLITACYNNFYPDRLNGAGESVQNLFQGIDSPWGAISTWAWGYSRLLEFAMQFPEIDLDRIIAIGHSRLGKTALWAAAQDTRFAGAISNNSGCLGAKISRRWFGETIYQIQKAFPYWFSPALEKYSNDPTKLPVDQHELLSLLAPRPVYVASAKEDQWADPQGEYMGAINASMVYSLFGREKLAFPKMPDLNKSHIGPVSYHIRNGIHGVTPFDWDCYLDFADKMVS